MVATQTKKLHEEIKDMLDGRPVQWLADKTGLNYTELTRKVKGDLVFRQQDIDRINTVFKTDFTLPA